VLACPGVDAIKLWPLPVQQPWVEDKSVDQTVILVIGSKAQEAVFRMTSDGGQKRYSNGMAEFISAGKKLLIKDIEWIYEISDFQKAAYIGKAFVIGLTLRDDEYELFQTTQTLPSRGCVARTHYLAQGLEISTCPKPRKKMWFGGGDSGLKRGILRFVLRGCLIKE